MFAAAAYSLSALDVMLNPHASPGLSVDGLAFSPTPLPRLGRGGKEGGWAHFLDAFIGRNCLYPAHLDNNPPQ